jgi:hypothetical protein
MKRESILVLNETNTKDFTINEEKREVDRVITKDEKEQSCLKMVKNKVKFKQGKQLVEVVFIEAFRTRPTIVVDEEEDKTLCGKVCARFKECIIF